MKNFVAPGDTVPLIAPSGGVESGDAFAVGGIFGVAAYSADAGAEVEAKRTGVFDLPKTTGQAWTVGLRLYWDSGAKKLTSTEGSNIFVGAALAAAGESATSGRVLLAGTVAAEPPPPPPPPPGP